MRSRKMATAVPAARSDGLLVEPIGDETVIYDTDSKQAHCLRPLAAIVFDCCDGHATIGEIANTAQQRLGDAVSDSDVADAVAQLEGVGLLQTALVVRAGNGLVATNGGGVSRREMLRRIGFAGAATAVGTTLVTSIVAPTADAATSGTPTGCGGCGTNSDCASNHCCTKGVVSHKNCQNGCCVGLNNSCHISGCTCSIGGAGCLARECGTGEGECICTCTVCSQDPGGCPTSCPTGHPLCCNVTACTQPVLE